MAAAAAVLAIMPLTTAAAQEPSPTVSDITLPVVDLELRSSSLDDSVATSESDGRTRVTLAADVLFRFNRASVTRRAESRLGEVVERIERRKPATVRITGYTDAKGAPGYNLALSRRRAKAVADGLEAQLGAGAPRLRIVGRGEAAPVAPNAKSDGTDNPKGRARNRRVTVSF